MEAIIYEFSCWVNADGIDVFNDVIEQLDASGHTVLTSASHQFEPQGYTCLWLLAESHCAMHTYPERNVVYVQLSSCSQPKYKQFVDGLLKRHQDARGIVEKVSVPQ